MKRLLVGAVLAMALAGAPNVWAGDTICRGTLSGVHDNVIVPRGASCFLNNATVHGNVQTLQGFGGLRMQNTMVHGSVQAEKGSPGNVRVDNSWIEGNLQVGLNGGSLQVHDNSIGGNLKVEKDFRGPGASIQRNRIRNGNLHYNLNTRPFHIIANNVIRNGKLECKENTPAPTGGGNIATDKEAQCAGL